MCISHTISWPASHARYIRAVWPTTEWGLLWLFWSRGSSRRPTETDTAEVRFSAVRSPQFWVSGHRTKWRIQGSFHRSSSRSLNVKTWLTNENDVNTFRGVTETFWLDTCFWNWYYIARLDFCRSIGSGLCSFPEGAQAHFPESAAGNRACR